MHFAHEILSAGELTNQPAKELTEKELKMAEALIESMAVAWEPDKYRDEYRTAMMELIEPKAQNREIAGRPEPAHTVWLQRMKRSKGMLRHVLAVSESIGNIVFEKRIARSGGALNSHKLRDDRHLIFRQRPWSQNLFASIRGGEIPPFIPPTTGESGALSPLPSTGRPNGARAPSDRPSPRSPFEARIGSSCPKHGGRAMPLRRATN